jgi:hypothetical protein
MLVAGRNPAVPGSRTKGCSINIYIEKNRKLFDIYEIILKKEKVTLPGGTHKE